MQNGCLQKSYEYVIYGSRSKRTKPPAVSGRYVYLDMQNERNVNDSQSSGPQLEEKLACLKDKVIVIHRRK
jgi:hypothetical protein